MSGAKLPRPGTHTKAALAAKARDKELHQEQLDKAVALHDGGNGPGPRRLVHLVEGCTKSQIETAIVKSKLKVARREAWQILTEIEESRLVGWIQACADNVRLRAQRQSQQLRRRPRSSSQTSSDAPMGASAGSRHAPWPA
tara:strand:- start:509 stop:931 length:423 start_codon:yes stop_codon:yes gene_type:complete